MRSRNGVIVVLSGMVAFTAGCATEECPSGVYVSAPLNCAAACSANPSLAPCGASDCEEIPFRAMSSNGIVEGGVVRSRSSGQTAVAWQLPEASCRLSGSTLYVGAGVVPARAVMLQQTSDGFASGSGIRWQADSSSILGGVDL